jgi:hypothetical protein
VKYFRARKSSSFVCHIHPLFIFPSVMIISPSFINNISI